MSSIPPPTELLGKGALLGVDFGTRRVGLAVCSGDQAWVSPLATLHRKSATHDLTALSRIIRQFNVQGIVLGLPIHMDGNESQKSRESRAYGDWLHKELNLPVLLWDERLSSAEADNLLDQTDLKHSERRVQRDKIAAQVILQSYIDSAKRSQLPSPEAAPRSSTPEIPTSPDLTEP